MLVFAAETSCDETSICLMENSSIVEHITFSQEIHKIHGGVVPELASRSHLEKIQIMTNELFSRKNIDPNEIDVFSATCGPGLIGSLLVGSTFTKSLAISFQKPFIPINHLEGHILSTSFNSDIKFPSLVLLLTGGHTQVYLMKDERNIELLGQSIDDAIGEAFDKCGKIMGLNYPAGPEIDQLAREGDPDEFDFPIPKVEGLDVSYSGLKTAFINLIHKNQSKNPNFIDENLNDLCASIQKSLVTVIMNKISLAKEKYNLKRVVLGGGVAANSEVRRILDEKAKQEQWEVFLPPFQYTTDNAAMIGIVGYLKLMVKKWGTMNQSVSARLSIS